MATKYLTAVILLLAGSSAFACDTGAYLDWNLGFRVGGDDVHSHGENSSDAIMRPSIGYRIGIKGDSSLYMELSHESDPADDGDTGQEVIYFGMDIPLGN